MRVSERMAAQHEEARRRWPAGGRRPWWRSACAMMEDMHPQSRMSTKMGSLGDDGVGLERVVVDDADDVAHRDRRFALRLLLEVDEAHGAIGLFLEQILHRRGQEMPQCSSANSGLGG